MKVAEYIQKNKETMPAELAEMLSMETSIWSNDDQIAIILNKDNGDNEMYNFMQEWRKWFSDITHNIEKLYNT